MFLLFFRRVNLCRPFFFFGLFRWICQFQWCCFVGCSCSTVFRCCLPASLCVCCCPFLLWIFPGSAGRLLTILLLAHAVWEPTLCFGKNIESNRTERMNGFVVRISYICFYVESLSSYTFRANGWFCVSKWLLKLWLCCFISVHVKNYCKYGVVEMVSLIQWAFVNVTRSILSLYFQCLYGNLKKYRLLGFFFFFDFLEFFGFPFFLFCVFRITKKQNVWIIRRFRLKKRLWSHLGSVPIDTHTDQGLRMLWKWSSIRQELFERREPTNVKVESSSHRGTPLFQGWPDGDYTVLWMLAVMLFYDGAQMEDSL